MGYSLAGFEVTGVDHAKQNHYPFTFIQADALAYVEQHGQEYDAVSASPPCQAYSTLKGLTTRDYPALIESTRAALLATGKPYVIENVVGAPLRWPLMLCGSMFALQTSCGAQLRRHRLFESNVLLMSPGHCRHGQRPLVVNEHEFRNEATRWEERRARTITVTGGTPQQNVERNRIRETFSVKDAGVAMGIDWMVMRELSQAIPPAYTKHIGHQVRASFATVGGPACSRP